MCKYKKNAASALQKQLNRSRCCLVCRLKWTQGSMHWLEVHTAATWQIQFNHLCETVMGGCCHKRWLAPWLLWAILLLSLSTNCCISKGMEIETNLCGVRWGWKSKSSEMTVGIDVISVSMQVSSWHHLHTTITVQNIYSTQWFNDYNVDKIIQPSIWTKEICKTRNHSKSSLCLHSK